MNRQLALLAAAAAAMTLSACDPKEKASKDGGDDRVAAYEAQRARKPKDGRTLVVDAPLSDAVGAYSNGDAYNAGSRFFDGSRGGTGSVGGNLVPAAYTPGSGGTRRFVWTTDDGKRSSDLNIAPPPLPDGHDYSDARTTLDTRGAAATLLGFAAFQIEQKFPSAAPVMSRLGWKARKPKEAYVAQTPTRVTVHHTQGKRPMTEAETAEVVRGIQYDHMYLRTKAGKQENFSDIGYHFLIAGDGRVVEGRPAEYVGAHARGANTDNIGISVMGDFNVIKPNEAQIVSLTRLVTYLSLKYKKDPSQKGFLEPHQHYTQTDCPGKNMMAILEALRQKIDDDHDRIANGGRVQDFSPLAVLPTGTTDS